MVINFIALFKNQDVLTDHQNRKVKAKISSQSKNKKLFICAIRHVFVDIEKNWKYEHEQYFAAYKAVLAASKKHNHEMKSNF